MSLSLKDPAQRRYVVRMLVFVAAYILVTTLLPVGHERSALSVPLVSALAVAAAVPILGQLWATLAMMAESDEFVRALIAKRFIVAGMLTMALATVWGIAESYAGVARLSATIVYPVFWICFGVVTPLVRTTR